MKIFFFCPKPKRIVKFSYIGAVGRGGTIVTVLKGNTRRKKIYGKTVISSRLHIYLFTVLVFLVNTASDM